MSRPIAGQTLFRTGASIIVTSYFTIQTTVAWVAAVGLLLATAFGVYTRRRRIAKSEQAAVEIQELQQQIALQREAHETESRRARRLELAIANVSVGLMVVDHNGDIVFINDALNDMLRGVQDGESGGSAVHPDQVVGNNIKFFSDTIDVTRRNTVDIQVGNHWCRLSIDPYHGDDLVEPGAVIVWKERTEEYAFEAEMEALVSGAAQGDLSRRVDVSIQSGFWRDLAENVNQLVGEADAIIQDTVRVLGAIARGELSETIDAEYEGSFDRLKQDANSTVGRLREVVENIRQSAEAVATAFREINQGNMNLSERTEQQASSLEETASSMEEMTCTVQTNAENARDANELALKARAEAEKGGGVVGQAIAAMVEINESSSRISDIISVIDEIAFQTNLLALNASVEAARAGEQGRGFAVVAGEVRNLAGRSAEAAKDVKHLIGDSLAKVKNGSTLVDESGKTLESIVERVNQVADIVAEISTASQEQATGIAQVNETINRMDDMTQQNAALVEEVSAASELAGDQAMRLQDMISFFSASEGQLDDVPTLDAPIDPEPEVRRLEPPAVSAQSSAVAGAPAAACPDFETDWEEF